MIRVARDSGRCQMRSGTDDPCLRLAAREIWGIPLCEKCAREQEAYAAIGELAQAQGMLSDWSSQVRRLHNEPLTDMLDHMQQELGGRIEEARKLLAVAKREARPVEDALQEARY